jgi:O-antigen/teichoic acid export membrane protein
MKAPHATLTKGAALTLVSYSVNNLIRLTTSIILARLLAPELFGIMVIVFTLRTGVELLSDVGIGQNIIYNKNAEDPDFYNTAWTLRAIRGVLLWLVTCTAAVPLAHFYDMPILATIVPVASLAIVLTGFSSLNAFLLQKRLQLRNLTVYDVIASTIAAAGQVVLAYFIPTIWGLVYGLLFAGTMALAWSYLVLPSVKYRFRMSRNYAWEILHFGKWISLTSIVYFLSISFDRLYLAAVVPLALLGIYGISRSISDLASGFALQLSNAVIFPYIARHSEVPRADLRNELAPLLQKLLLIAALGF